MSHRIVSLLPAATEIVCELGAESLLVGRSHECDFPQSVQRLPICSSPRIDINGSSREIDDLVKQTLHNGLSLFEVDVEQIRRLEPTLILTQIQCEVCAVSLADVETALATTISLNPRLVSLSPNQLSDVFGDVRQIANELGLSMMGNSLVERMQERMSRVQNAIRNVDGEVSSPSVVCIEWIEPLMTAGNWVPELVSIAGGRNLLSETGKHSPWLNWQELVEADPDILILMPCGWSMERTRADLHWLTERTQWSSLRAVSAGQVFIVDGHHYFNRPGPRLVDSVEILAEILHPGRVDFGHRGTGWAPL